ncbi:TPA: hypothetical protein ACH3X1_000284 [Trebouxia sp. C0004]
MWCTQCRQRLRTCTILTMVSVGACVGSQVLQTLLNCAACVASQTNEASIIGPLLFIDCVTATQALSYNVVLLHKCFKWFLDLAWHLPSMFVNKSRNLKAMLLVVLLAFWHSPSPLLVQCTDLLLRSSQMAAVSSDLFLC